MLTLLSIPFFLIGLIIFWLSHQSLAEYWSVMLELKEHHRLMTHGIFRRIRHPMYLAI